jgi:hypothetical protein
VRFTIDGTDYVNAPALKEGLSKSWLKAPRHSAPRVGWRRRQVPGVTGRPNHEPSQALATDTSARNRSARPVYHHQRDSIEAHLTIVFAALAVSRWVEHQTGSSIRKVREDRPPLPHHPDPMPLS